MLQLRAECRVVERVPVEEEVRERLDVRLLHHAVGVDVVRQRGAPTLKVGLVVARQPAATRPSPQHVAALLR